MLVKTFENGSSIKLDFCEVLQTYPPPPYESLSYGTAQRGQAIYDVAFDFSSTYVFKARIFAHLKNKVDLSR